MEVAAPYAHQMEGARLLAENTNFALLAEMGAGKSRMVCMDFEYKYKFQGLKNMVVVAPAGSYRNWEGELQRWLDEPIWKSIKLFTWISGKSKPKEFREFLAYSGDKPRVLLMNVEALSRVVVARDGLKEFLSSAPTMWVVDESQCIKAPDSARTKFILSVAPLAKWKRILTGMVAPENPLNVYSQFDFLNWEILGFRSFYGFRARYAITKKVDFRQGGRPVDIVVGYRHVEELHKKIAGSSYRVRTADVVDLPPKIYMPLRHVEMTPEQSKAYAEMKRLAMTEINGQYVTAQIAAAVLTKLHSILCGHVVDENGQLHDVPSNRIDSLLELLSDHSGKAIIWAPYPRFLTKIAEALEKEYGEDSTARFWGETSNDDRQLGKKRFQEDPKCRWFVSNQSVGGEGNTLTAATLVVYAANSWKNSERQQSEARAHRIGQTAPVTYVDLAVRGSMEEKLIKALRGKMDLAALISGDRVKEWLI
jgi:SNF2 family DNA or RNA helicase